MSSKENTVSSARESSVQDSSAEKQERRAAAPLEPVQGVWEQLERRRRAEDIRNLLEMNEKTEQFGLALTRSQAEALILARGVSLQNHRRVELGGGILKKLVFEFCDSCYLNPDNYEETLELLLDIFYRLKNESQDLMTDDEALHFLREQFDTVCAGDLDYLESTCLERLSRSVRAGGKEHEMFDGRGMYDGVDEEQRWDPELYYQVLRENT